MITEHKTFAGFTSHLSVLLIPDRCSHHPKIIRFLLHDTSGSPNIVTRERSEPRSSSVSFDQRYLKMPISSLPFQIQGKFQPMPSQYPPRVTLTDSSMWPLPPEAGPGPFRVQYLILWHEAVASRRLPYQPHLLRSHLERTAPMW